MPNPTYFDSAAKFNCCTLDCVGNLKQISPVNHDRANPLHIVAAEMRRAEDKLAELIDSREALIAEICRYLVNAGGKRLRPTFVLLIYRACGGGDARLEDAIDAAIAMELIHSATLLHDDIIDAGTVRRGKPSAFTLYGLGPSLVAGDYLFARAFELCGKFEDELVRIAAQACVQLTEGEVMEGRLRRNEQVTIDDYLGVISRKTASLFRAGAQVGAQLAGALTKASAMGRLGEAFGLAFQMIDDLLDILGPEEKIGKPVGSDLRAGIPSLPVVLGVERDSRLSKLLRAETGADGPGFERLLELLRAPELVERARAMALEQVTVARKTLAELRPSPYRDSLAALIEEQVHREL
jgi:geranylgeranyl pyrophosphate synthase